VIPIATIADRLAAGPISWGVCEVPGWGVQLPPERVFREMRSLGITATEAGPVGYLGDHAAAVSDTLAAAGMRLVGAFLPVVLHDPAGLEETLAAARETSALLAATGATKLISAAVVDLGWSPRVTLDDDAWRHVFESLGRIDDIAADAGLEHVLHPHANTIVELDEDLARVLEGCDVRICLDTGHLAIGGTDVVALAEGSSDRVGHVHLKDVKLDVADRFRRREVDLVEATRQGLFCALGDGDVPVADTIRALESGGYTGWYVLEQDTTLEPADVEGTRPLEDAARSVAFLQRCLAGREGGDTIG
jgi:inosose dehydratase